MRHGEAERSASSDSQRQLTDHGKKQCYDINRQLIEGKHKIDKIIVSPFLRAQQTAQIIAEQFSVTNIISSDAITPDIPCNVALSELAGEVVANTLLVSHLPLVDELVSLLVDGQRQQSYPFGTATCAVLHAEFWSIGNSSVEKFIQPLILK